MGLKGDPGLGLGYHVSPVATCEVEVSVCLDVMVGNAEDGWVGQWVEAGLGKYDTLVDLQEQSFDGSGGGGATASSFSWHWPQVPIR
jgi:hypothetical protein